MTKHIVELTESQRQYLLGMVMVEEVQITNRLEELLPSPDKDNWKKALAFTKRVKSTLVKAKTS